MVLSRITACPPLFQSGGIAGIRRRSGERRHIGFGIVIGDARGLVRKRDSDRFHSRNRLQAAAHDVRASTLAIARNARAFLSVT